MWKIKVELWLMESKSFLSLLVLKLTMNQLTNSVV